MSKDSILLFSISSSAVKPSNRTDWSLGQFEITFVNAFFVPKLQKKTLENI